MSVKFNRNFNRHVVKINNWLNKLKKRLRSMRIFNSLVRNYLQKINCSNRGSITMKLVKFRKSKDPSLIKYKVVLLFPNAKISTLNNKEIKTLFALKIQRSPTIISAQLKAARKPNRNLLNPKLKKNYQLLYLPSHTEEIPSVLVRRQTSLRKRFQLPIKGQRIRALKLLGVKKELSPEKK